MQEKGNWLTNIHESFAATEFGQTLAERVRFERYKPVDVSNEEWVRLLGADVSNLKHLPLTRNLAHVFGQIALERQPDLINEREVKQLEVAGMIHDWAEAIVGDITYSEKTLDDEMAETMAFDANLERFYHGPAVKLIHTARKEIIFDKTSKLGRIFDGIERVGYMRTALRASEHVLNGTAPESCNTGLKWLAALVLSNQVVPILDHASRLKPVEQYVVNQQATIDRAFGLVANEPGIFERYGDSVDLRLAAFQESQMAWNTRPSQLTNRSAA